MTEVHVNVTEASPSEVDVEVIAAPVQVGLGPDAPPVKVVVGTAPQPVQVIAQTLAPVQVAVPSAAPGGPGASAYQVAVTNGFVGTEAEWLASLQGEDGTPGTNGANAQFVMLENLAAYIALDAATQMDGRWYVVKKT